MVQSPGSRSRRCSLRGITLDGIASGESLSSVQPPSSRSRRYSSRETLSTVQGSRSRQSSHQGAALYGTASGSHSLRCSLRGVALDGAVSGESLSSMQPLGSRSLWCSLRGVTVYGPAVLSPRSRTRRSLSFVRY